MKWFQRLLAISVLFVIVFCFILVKIIKPIYRGRLHQEMTKNIVFTEIKKQILRPGSENRMESNNQRNAFIGNQADHFGKHTDDKNKVAGEFFKETSPKQYLAKTGKKYKKKHSIAGKTKYYEAKILDINIRESARQLRMEKTSPTQIKNLKVKHKMHSGNKFQKHGIDGESIQKDKKQAEYKDTQVHLELHQEDVDYIQDYQTQAEDLPRMTNGCSWCQFYNEISSQQLYSSSDTVMKLLNDMQTLPIIAVDSMKGGTQLKLIVTFQNGHKAILKPQRFPVDHETKPDHFYFVDFERANAEIAAFHLDRILGFHWAPPVTGRLLNISSEILPHADAAFLRTVFISPANNLCFHGDCSYYCDTTHAFCGQPDSIAVSLAVMLPQQNVMRRKAWQHPWQRTYSKTHQTAVWEIDSSYCDHVRRHPLYRSGRKLLDIVDMAILDFLIGNMDRHHYETFAQYGNDTFPLAIDQGRGFGRPFHDEVSILAPLTQCCVVRHSTLQRLREIYHGTYKLSSLMRESLSHIHVPTLTEKHLNALDRRLTKVIKQVTNCVLQKGPENVIFNGTLPMV